MASVDVLAIPRNSMLENEFTINEPNADLYTLNKCILKSVKHLP